MTLEAIPYVAFIICIALLLLIGLPILLLWACIDEGKVDMDGVIIVIAIGCTVWGTIGTFIAITALLYWLP